MVSRSYPKNIKIGKIFFFLLCLISQILPVVRSGLPSIYGIGFWGPNGHDGIWHLALINHINNPFKILHPSISGEYLQNYHPFYDILVSFLSKVSHLGSSLWLFQIMPILMSFTMIILSFKLAKKLFNNNLSAYILVFLNCFATSFGWIISLIRYGNFYGESIFWSMQSFSNQLNPPFALSLVMILTLLLLVLDKDINSNHFKQILLLILTIILPITKAYAALSWYIILFLLAVYQFKQKKSLLFKLFLISLIPTFLIFSIYNHTSTSLFEFNPFWFIHSMFQYSDHLFIPIIASFQYNQWLASHVFTPKYLFVEAFGLIVFLVGNFSWRLLGFNKTRDPLLISIIISVIASTAVTLFFVQKGTPWNTIQFLYYSLFLSNILLTGYLYKNKKLLIIVIFTTLLGNIGNFQTYLGNPPPTAITPDELKALAFLKNLPAGVVLTFPYNQYSRNQFISTPLPIYAYETTSYVPAFSLKPTYLSDEMNLNISGYDWPTRRQNSQVFFEQKKIFENRGFLLNNFIDYIFLDGPQASSINFNLSMSLKELYRQNDIVIYRVNR